MFIQTIADFQVSDVQGTLPDYLATVSWGDKTTLTTAQIAPNGVNHFSVIGDHLYARPGQYSVQVTILGAASSSAAGTGTAIINVAPLNLHPTTISATAGVPLINGTVATFNDSYVGLGVSDYQSTIQWGDGHVTAGIIVPQSPSGFVVQGNNTYSAPGSQLVGVTVTRKIDGGTQSIFTPATVFAPEIAGTGTVISSVIGSTFIVKVASFSDTTPPSSLGSYAATIDWGDKSPISAGTPAPNAAGGVDVSGSHSYSAPGSYLRGNVRHHL